VGDPDRQAAFVRERDEPPERLGDRGFGDFDVERFLGVGFVRAVDRRDPCGRFCPLPDRALVRPSDERSPVRADRAIS
jgi:hypothetical protein